MERAAPGNRSIVDGWLARYLASAGGGKAIAGVTLRHTRAKALQGAAPSLAFPSLGGFALSGDAIDERRAALEQRYAEVGAGAAGSASSVKPPISPSRPSTCSPAVDRTTSVLYPASELGTALKDAAALDQGRGRGARDRRRRSAAGITTPTRILRTEEVGSDLAASLAAFHADLGAHAATTLTLAMTEFGRRVPENGSGGTDHGHGGVMMALGGGITGRRVLLAGGTWPGLAPERLHRGEDLAVTTDFRSVFAEALQRHLLVNGAELATILPGFSIATDDFPGLWG